MLENVLAHSPKLTRKIMARKPASRLVDTHFEDLSKYQASNDRSAPPSNRLKLRIEDLKTFKPLSKNQKLFFEAYANEDEAIMLYGSAGTGKTAISLYRALEQVLDKGNSFQKVVIIRTCVPTRELGYLPGDADEKLAVYSDPYVKLCAELFNRKDAYSRLVEQNHIEFVSSSFLRGTTFDNSIIIFDEIQNANWAEIKTIMTRLGKNTKIILCGDYSQTDLLKTRNDSTGFNSMLSVANAMNEFTLIQFDTADIVRSKFVKSFIITCEDLGL